DRISYMVNDSGVSCVVSSVALSDRLAGSCQVIEVDGSDRDLIDACSTEAVSSGVSSSNLAYVIYTSGSTGRPKGVMVEHRNVVRLLVNEHPLFDFGANDVWSLFHSFCFDFSVWEMYGALCFGGKLVLIPNSIAKDAVAFAKLVNSEKVTVLNQTPSAFDLFQESFLDLGFDSRIRYIIFGGEALNPNKLSRWKRQFRDCALINMYGITETTVHVTFREISSSDITSGISVIGRPIPTLNAYILDSSGGLCPVGVAGELYIGGSGVARGYLHRADLTQERFIASPFVEGDRLYRTGDLGRWLPDGNIEYVGRMDDQVKVRGYRIELGEVESVLQTAPGVSQGVVVARSDDSGHKRLIGYYVGVGVLREQVQAHLASQLPDYMVPGVLVELDSLPLTPNGKVDRQGLPDPDFESLVSRGYVAPETETEQVLAGIWAELLGLDRVGIHDNFFELGGDSIITIQVVSRAKRQGYYLTPRDLFSSQTVAKLSELVTLAGDQSEVGEQGILSGSSGLLPIQDWYFSDVWEGISHFNQAVLLTLSRKVSFEALSLCMQRLVYQHDALRFVYQQDSSGTFTQHYGEEVSRRLLSYHDLSGSADANLSETLSKQASILQGSLDIYSGDLVRAGYFQMPSAETDNRLLIVVHHLAVDGVSWRVLLEDLQVLIDQHESGLSLDLGSKGYSYRQWYEWLSVYGGSTRVLSQLGYWERSVEGSGRLLTDRSHEGSVLLSQTGSVRSELGLPETDLLLHQCSRVYQTEINDILLCALRESLGSILEGGDLLVGLEGHGREVLDSGADLSRTVGWFTSLYPVLLRGDWPVGDTGASLKSIKEQLRQVPDKGLGYGVLKYVQGAESLTGADPWEVVFNYLGQFDNLVERSGHLRGTPSGEDAGHSIEGSYRIRYKLSVTAVVRDQRLVLDWNYSTQHFERSTIERLSDLYTSSLQKLISHCVQQVTAVRTPSDYGLGAEISYQELDRYFSVRLADGRLRGQVVEDIYRLSGLQEGMLFHGLYEHDHSSYIEQVSCRLRGVDKNVFIRSWELVIKRHSILRSSFEPGFFDIPVQCVYADVVLPLYEADYRGLDATAQSAAIRTYAEQDRRSGFSFDEVPLLRLSLLQTGYKEYRMIWTYHHLLLDGWSTPLLVEELLEEYEQLLSGTSGGDVVVDEYGDYIRYIEGRKEAGVSQSYWREYLSGLETGSLLPFIGPSALRTKGVGEYKELSLRLDAYESGQVESYGQKHRLTVNTIMQGVWAYLLHSYTGQRDVVYGVTVSGRPDDLAGVERRIGMYINTLPLHGYIDPTMGIVDWLTGIQASQLASHEHQYSSLSDIQQWTGIKGDLFDS
ncbi:MAG: amino acid adenylation domain-containing protein, partial [Imperialibacter sp.]|uniref:amino acid adenylation domain-containing protein n=1 Tax=Imperialibacter sp. TaxID=2038411 RepID=UPI0032F03269